MTDAKEKALHFIADCKDIKKIKEDLIKTHQLLEQAELRADKAEMYIEEIYPAINEIEIKQGWHSGCGTSTYKVTFDVYAEDLTKLIRFLTNRKLKDKKWSMIHSEIQERIRREVKQEYGIKNG